MEDSPMDENLPYILVSTHYDTKKAMRGQREAFCLGYINLKRVELGTEKMNREKQKLWDYAGKCWDLAQEGKRRFHELEEESGRRIMQWKELEKPLRQWLENDAEGNEWGQDAVERTVEARHRGFVRKQNRIRTRQKRIRDPDADFRKRVLNPETREAAITKYVQNHRVGGITQIWH
jgi:hypothetical protein